ncbi:MAG: 3-hydroxyacyl-ACP dehydratase [Myroides sp.]|jgi:3-hydroxyacyl-[acyl-carrier-protein] dehydratase|uniref:3-hydroxyacyl-ACP dehydratase n=1 Tax=Myroides marinus TaxID=703342 RepID=A0A161S7W3_9FLAO|nr:3-hydroxyacyl-ACP dehydratase [Myroides marinus]MDR0194519.1 3-hydroxyacyl-ACP dehydratase [Myroides sp.]KUF44703.1 3-hydroxyacyl-ACP dehydratase [Myroides marinus]KZE81344.1 3-hydroxyacyl-ACP dehydratase [Myroides marinus]MDM1360572.1 3-hydroxyacyl-ACP dehydratase [Myroides marinus]MDM1367476.1 3-hydroxyacyl-ACP dehydratase [Myroides marinus]
MLIDNFYEVVSLETANTNQHTALVRLNTSHDVFKGHFPNNPVMPGICMIQIIKELSEEILKYELFMEQVLNVKFMTLINPEKCNELTFSLQIDEVDGAVKVKSAIDFEGAVALKMSSTYKKK